MRIVVQHAPFDHGAEANAFGAGRTDVGAIVTFSGIVRDTNGDLEAMEIEHYPGMTEAALTEIAHDASNRWALADVLVIHRYGHLKPGEPIMMVALEGLIEHIKTREGVWFATHEEAARYVRTQAGMEPR